MITKLFRIAGNGGGGGGKEWGIRYRSSGFRGLGWARTIVENECQATRNFQLGLKGLVRDSLRFRVYGDTVKFAGNGALETLAGSLLRADDISECGRRTMAGN